MKTKYLLKNVFYINPINEERVLNKYAKEGWSLKKSNSFYYKLEKTGEKNKKYSVQYVENLKRIGDKLSEQDKMFIELCESENWKFISKASNFLYFETDIENESEIRTDDEAYKKSLFKLMLFYELPFFLIYLSGLLYTFFVAYKTGIAFLSNFSLTLGTWGICGLFFGILCIVLTLVEKLALDFPNKKIERIKVVLKNIEYVCFIVSFLLFIFFPAFSKVSYEAAGVLLTFAISVPTIVLFNKSVKLKSFIIIIFAVFAILLLVLLVVLAPRLRERAEDIYVGELSNKTEQECFEIANTLYEKYSGNEEGLAAPAFVDNSSQNYKGSSVKISTIVSTYYVCTLKDETTNECFDITCISTCDDLLRDYYFHYYIAKGDNKKFDNWMKLLEKNDYEIEKEERFVLAKDGVILFVNNHTPEEDDEKEDLVEAATNWL